jgi:hypothetical protein
MLNVVYAVCLKYAIYAVCHYADCPYTECRYAECHGANLIFVSKTGAYTS